MVQVHDFRFNYIKVYNIKEQIIEVAGENKLVIIIVWVH
jgi:hypothetical protein